MELTSLQLFTAAVVGLFYVPCVAMMAAIAREFTLATAAAVTGLTILVALVLGALVAQGGGIFL